MFEGTPEQARDKIKFQVRTYVIFSTYLRIFATYLRVRTYVPMHLRKTLAGPHRVFEDPQSRPARSPRCV